MKDVLFLGFFIFFTSTLFAVEQTLTLQINDGADDMEEWLDPAKAGATDYQSSDLELGSESKDGLTPQMVGLRFKNVSLAKGTKINSAVIEFELDNTSKNADPFEVYIWAENADNAAVFNDNAQSVPYSVSSRSRMTDSIKWTIAAGEFNVVDTKAQTSDIAPLLQKLVDRNNWASGNAVAFFIKGKGTREVEAFEGEASAAPKLIVKYESVATDINDANATEAVVFPNPTSENVNVSGVENIQSLELINLNGISVISANNVSTLNVSNIENGSYILKIKTADTQLFKKVQIIR